MGKFHSNADVGDREVTYGLESVFNDADEFRKRQPAAYIEQCVQVAILRQLQRLNASLNAMHVSIKESVELAIEKQKLAIEIQKRATAKALAEAAKWNAKQAEADARRQPATVQYIDLTPEEIEQAIEHRRGHKF